MIVHLSTIKNNLIGNWPQFIILCSKVIGLVKSNIAGKTHKGVGAGGGVGGGVETVICKITAWAESKGNLIKVLQIHIQKV